MNLLDERARTHPNQPALLRPNRERDWTFKELKKGVDSTIHRLRSHGLSPRDTLGFQLTPGSTFVRLYLASVKLGLTLVPLPVETTLSKLKHRVKESEIDFLVTDEPVKKKSPWTKITFLTPESLVEPSLSSQSYERNFSDRHRLIIYTSGTTGQPKGVILSWENLLANARASRKRLGRRGDDLWLSPLPVHHVGGIAPVVRSLWNATSVLLVEYETNSLLKWHCQYSITGCSLVPTMLRDLLKYQDEWETSSLRFILVGGASTPLTLRRRATQHRIPLYPTYGMTETTSQVATATPDEAINFLSSVGHPLDGLNVTIRNEKGEPLPHGETGEIVIDGPTIAEGYFKRKSLNRTLFSSDGFYTGDLGYLDEEGRLYVVGRKDRRIISGGETIDPSEVESLLREHSQVRDAAVYGKSDDRLGEKVCAAVEGTTGASVTEEELKDYVSQHLPPKKVPRTVKLLNELPRTASGTIDYGSLT